jgi:hypothetical protein
MCVHTHAQMHKHSITPPFILCGSLPLLKEILSHLYLIWWTSYCDYAIIRPRQRFINCDSCSRIRSDFPYSCATLSNDSTCQLKNDIHSSENVHRMQLILYVYIICYSAHCPDSSVTCEQQGRCKWGCVVSHTAVLWQQTWFATHSCLTHQHTPFNPTTYQRTR